MACEICGIIEESFYETENFSVVLSFKQAYLGRLLVISKRHVQSLSDLSEEEWKDFSELVKVLESAIKKAFGTRLFNWGCLMNHAYQSKNPEPHVHWHVRPRYDKEVEFAGKKFTDPHFGKHYNRERDEKVSDEVQRKIIEEIKKYL
ncbi:MAG: HIT family protein [Candidatus Paceibacteria bacterium]